MAEVNVEICRAEGNDSGMNLKVTYSLARDRKQSGRLVFCWNTPFCLSESEGKEKAYKNIRIGFATEIQYFTHRLMIINLRPAKNSTSLTDLFRYSTYFCNVYFLSLIENWAKLKVIKSILSKLQFFRISDTRVRLLKIVFWNATPCSLIDFLRTFWRNVESLCSG
jgi:hypothetical protein